MGRRLFAFFVFAVVFVALTDALPTEKAKTTELALLDYDNADNSDSPTKRSLRIVDSTDAAAEERGIQSSLLSGLSKLTKTVKLKKLSNKLQVKAWQKAELDPKDVYRILGYTGKPLASVENLPGYKLWLQFNAAWLKAGGRYQ